MNPFMMQQDIPKIKDLWKNEVDKYRLWIILFIIGVFSIAILSFVAILLNGLSINTGINAYWKIMDANAPKNVTITYEQARLSYLSTMIIVPTFMLLLIITALILFSITIVRSYKTHNFARLSWGSIFIVQLSAFFALINITQFLFMGARSVQLSSNSGSIYSFIIMFLYMPIWFFANRVSNIRKLFLRSEQMEKLKNDPNYQNMMRQMQQLSQNMSNTQSPFGFNPYNQNNTNTTSSKNTTNNAQKKTNKVSSATSHAQQSTSKLSEIDKQLAKLTIKQLREIAKKLYIFGYESMSRVDLISSIKRATQDSK